ncbi:MAG: DUF4148 domain-containing protein [Polaromonas sp.]|uniref:DUF4148 domain-containing protein n=1 Tax=Polaromonas sp. TaxID=1869339 RepID=UPI0025E4FD44|nr:DUF4148 domain-containing protein [Polaromonas sp.]MBI2728030.1 DUF4148 domain-containing protein [Polaromonas sp.]
MNSKLIASTVIALSALTGASAFAQNLSGEAALAIRPVASSSNVTRAQVQNDYLQARQAGKVAASQEGAFAAAPAAASVVTRAEVRNDAVVSARAAQIGNSTI